MKNTWESEFSSTRETAQKVHKAVIEIAKENNVEISYTIKVPANQ